jgi:hypothetical protein
VTARSRSTIDIQMQAANHRGARLEGARLVRGATIVINNRQYRRVRVQTGRQPGPVRVWTGPRGSHMPALHRPQNPNVCDTLRNASMTALFNFAAS